MNRKNSQLRDSLSIPESIVYRQDGNRSLHPEEIYGLAIKYALKIGITSLNEVGTIINSPLPIYSARRVESKNHYLYGGALNSLGKGSSDLQSKISCLMEGIEYSCMENIPNDLVRASFNFLSQSHLVLRPDFIFRSTENISPALDEMLMWTKGYSPKLNAEVFIPAELVYFPFLAEDYSTQHYFNPSTNGIASGATFLEATIHALYEVIERAFLGHKELKLGYSTPFDANSFLSKSPAFGETEQKFQLRFFILESFLLPDIPVVECVASYNGKTVMGHGCSFNFQTAVERAYAEALQSLSVYGTGDREELMMSMIDKRAMAFPYAQKKTLLRVENYLPKETIVLNEKIKPEDILRKFPFAEREFQTLNEEYNELQQYLKNSGHEEFYITNLTPVDSHFAVVKVISTSLMSKGTFYGYANFQDMRVTRLASFQYRTINKSLK